MNPTPIGYPDLDALPGDLREAVVSRGSLNIYRMVAHSPGLATSFLTMASDVLQHNSLPPHWRELAILRVGHAYGAGYEVHHHNNIGRAVGLDDAALAAVAGPAADGLGANESAVVRITDLLLVQHTLTDSEVNEALTHLTVNQFADLVLTVGFYQLVCNFLNTFRITPEGEGTGL
jgi:4-carboxymuconolactone decarboxylase